MQRRTFLSGVAASPLLGRLAAAGDLPRDICITRILGFHVTARRSKIAGKNSQKDVHGDRAVDRLARIATSAGVEGVGGCRMRKEDALRLLGKSPFDFLDVRRKMASGPIGPGTMPLWDLAGKLLDKPVYELLGGAGRDRVPVYDGSIYFADLLPQYASRWRDRFREEIDMGLAIGHRAFKIKIGRGAKWMPRAAGDARDVEVVQLIRRHVGEGVLLGVDANNGYNVEGAKRLFDRIGSSDIAFAEEMFPETVGACLEFQAHLRENGWRTLVADGESQSVLDAFEPFMEARAIDIYQADMRRFGFEGILAEAAMAKRRGLVVAPHNWGSLVGFYMQLQVGRAISNFYRAEHDPLSTDVLLADGYAIADGASTAPDRPGCGLLIDEAKFAAQARVVYDVSV